MDKGMKTNKDTGMDMDTEMNMNMDMDMNTDTRHGHGHRNLVHIIKPTLNHLLSHPFNYTTLQPNTIGILHSAAAYRTVALH
jgi:hypothetical protein